jgi:hypothetical protein
VDVNDEKGMRAHGDFRVLRLLRLFALDARQGA